MLYCYKQMINNICLNNCFNNVSGYYRNSSSSKHSLIESTKMHHSVPRSLPETPISQPISPPLPKKRRCPISFDHPNTNAIIFYLINISSNVKNHILHYKVGMASKYTTVVNVPHQVFPKYM